MVDENAGQQKIKTDHGSDGCGSIHIEGVLYALYSSELVPEIDPDNYHPLLFVLE